ncbi:MAG: right-handed parallel beta-helix repeat-containing protein [Phycisphaerae bacterium]|nr:right-handed parallel beta-helix repeat-containing protein [Phycisphaerae bacterium]
MKLGLASCVALAGLLTPIGSAGTIYVDADAPLGGDGTSWDSAFKYLQDALHTAVAGDEIRVGGGLGAGGATKTYKPDLSEHGYVTLGARNEAFQLINGVAVRGGYAGYGAPNPDLRDIANCETILSGDLLGNDEPDFVNNDENSYHIVNDSGTDGTAIIDGFTITAGNADGDFQQGYEFGGGMYNDGGSPTLTNCTFSGNSAASGGGGMYNYVGSSTVTNCTFSENVADYAGGILCSGTLTNCTISGNGNGGVRCSGTTTLYDCIISSNNDYGISCTGNITLSNCTVSSNDGEGILYHSVDSGLISDCTIIDNASIGISLTYSSSISVVNCNIMNNRGPGVSVGDNTSNITISDCQICNNSTSESGGGIICGGDALIEECMITGNSADIGGGVYCFSDARVSDCTIIANSAESGGGALCAGNAVLSNCVITSNLAGGTHPTAGIGGGILCSEGSPSITNCLLTGNIAANDGGGAYVAAECMMANCTTSTNFALVFGGGLCVSSSNPAFCSSRNCVFWGNSAGLGNELAVLGPTELRVVCSDVCGGIAGSYVDDSAALYWGLGNIDADPLFSNPTADEFRLSSGSPCIDAGDNYSVTEVVDLDGNPRLVDDPATPDTGYGESPIVDMGAYEYQVAVPICHGDSNCDGLISWHDIDYFVAAMNDNTVAWEAMFSPESPACAFANNDANGDGTVNWRDIDPLVAMMNMTCP